MSDNALPILLGVGAAGGLLWFASRKAHARTPGTSTEGRIGAIASAPTVTEGPARDPDRASPPAAPAPNAPTASTPPASAPSGTRPPERATPEAAAESTPSPLPGRWIWPVEVYNGRRSVITQPWSTNPAHIHKGVDILFPRVPGDTPTGRPAKYLPAVERWRPLVTELAGGLNVDFLLTWIQHESGGRPCATGIPGKETGLFQTYHPHDDRHGATFEQLRTACAPGKQTEQRPLTDAEQRLQVTTGIALVRACVETANSTLSAIGAKWSTRDRYCLAKLVHAIPAYVYRFPLVYSVKHGRPPSSWAELRTWVRSLSEPAVIEMAPAAKPWASLEQRDRLFDLSERVGEAVTRGHSKFVVPEGVRALAASDGIVWSASRMPRGFTVVIDHGSHATFYTHLSRLLVAPTKRAASKQRVYAGQPIGIIGADPMDPAGLPHLHFELWKGGPADAIDPAPLMRWWEHLSPPPTLPTSTISTAPRPAPTTEPPRAQSTSALRLDFGRPVPAGIRAVVGSGWASPRGTGATRRLHRALDIGLPIGTPILAIDQGVVTFVQSQDIGDAGIWIAVRHPSGIISRYIHLARALVKVGQVVQRGEQIGLSGDTASPGVPHLHLDLRAPAAMLPAIEATFGRPRSGWGPEMKPFGHSIPGEPLIPVDAYRESVRTEAAAMGIPLRDLSLPRNDTGTRNAKLSYRPVGQRGEPYPEWVRELDGKSGAYVIREIGPDGKPEIVYVGQSSANRLYDTLTRHFQQWRRWKGFWRGQYSEGPDPGLTYNRDRVDVAVRITPASRALDEEARLIRRLRPRDNQIGQPEEEAIPF